MGGTWSELTETRGDGTAVMAAEDADAVVERLRAAGASVSVRGSRRGRLREENRALTNGTTASQAEVLRVIASSPAEVGAVLNTLVESAARLGEGDMAAVIRAEGGLLRVSPPPRRPDWHYTALWSGLRQWSGAARG